MRAHELIERVQKNVESPTISTDTGLEAARKIGEIAEQENIEWALADGLAMCLYGSPRLTKDVDIYWLKLRFARSKRTADFRLKKLPHRVWQIQGRG